MTDSSMAMRFSTELYDASTVRERITEVLDAEYLPEVLRAFVEHLQASGFHWVEGLTAHCDTLDWNDKGEKTER